ncbi:hypothetical protein AB0F81_12075 [Actinoplanes sp. NPDC024001]|uniref:hypothetical protein n=1 Tax=Actinoplanes sp. NPDC024001 TaxID=3154598 RepID=UPI0033C8D119
MKIRQALFSIAGAVAALAMGSPAMATSVPYLGSVDVIAIDASGNTIVLLNNVSILNGAQFCNVDVNVVAAVLGDDKNAKCTSKTNNHQKAYIKKHS